MSEETYVEQGLYWETAYRPLIRYVLDTYQPDLALVGYPVTAEFRHQFLGLVTRRLPNGAANPAFADVQVDGTRDFRVRARRTFLRRAYRGADATMRLAQTRLRDRDVTTFVGSDHGFAPQFAAVDASKALVDHGLLSTPQTSDCRPASGETIGKAKGLLGRRDGPDLPQPGRARPGGRRLRAGAGGRRGRDRRRDQGGLPGPRRPERLDRRRAARGLGGHRSRVREGGGAPHPERPGLHRGHGAPDAHRRSRRLLRAAVPVRRGDAGHADRALGVLRPARLRPGRAGPREQHEHARDVPRGRRRDRARGRRGHAQHRPRAHGGVPARRPVAAAQPGRRAARRARRGGGYTPLPIIGLNDFHGQLEQTTTLIDGRTVTVGGAAQLATLFDEEAAALPGRTLLLAAGDNVGASPPSSALLEDRPAIDVENAWGLDATSLGNHEFDFGVERLLAQIERADFPFLSANIVEEATGEPPAWLRGSAVFDVAGVRVGVIGATVRTTPELVRADATAGLQFLDEAERIRGEAERLRAAGVEVQIVVVHEGAVLGANPVDGQPAAPWEGPVIGIVEARIRACGPTCRCRRRRPARPTGRSRVHRR